MGYRHTKEEILDAALDASLDEGLSQLTFGRLAKRLGISDRIIVYYFPSKDDLIGEVLVALGTKLQAALAPALSSPVSDHVELLRVSWPILACVEADPVFALFFEAGGLAAVGREPFHTLVPQLVQAWIDWAASVISGSVAHRRIEAETAIANIDGLLILRQLAGPEIAARAARRLLAQRPRPSR